MPLNQITPLVGIPLSQIWGPLVLQGLAGAFEGAGAQGAELDGAEVSDLFRSAGMASIAGGTANAASTLADYYIQRAEQYQPVISLYGGSKVEIVFLEDVDLSGSR